MTNRLPLSFQPERPSRIVSIIWHRFTITCAERSGKRELQGVGLLVELSFAFVLGIRLLFLAGDHDFEINRSACKLDFDILKRAEIKYDISMKMEKDKGKTGEWHSHKEYPKGVWHRQFE